MGKARSVLGGVLSSLRSGYSSRRRGEEPDYGRNARRPVSESRARREEGGFERQAPPEDRLPAVTAVFSGDPDIFGLRDYTSLEPPPSQILAMPEGVRFTLYRGAQRRQLNGLYAALQSAKKEGAHETEDTLRKDIGDRERALLLHYGFVDMNLVRELRKKFPSRASSQ
ncbi:MAG: hypothetical protein ACP5E4_01185 [Candidatus Aenigmatarchaeota archaeon]